jgi:molecular chaperone HscB
MNYFELFGLPVQLKVDKESLRKKYFELSRQSHPDYFVQTDGAEQQEVLEASALLNKAFKTFSNTDETIKYVLQQKDLLEEEEKYNLPSSFLMQMMDINEEAADAQMEDDETLKTKMLADLKELQKEMYEPVESIVENYNEGVTTEKELLQVKEYYFKKKYLQRLATQLGQKL